ncbi:MAG: divalent-cation tolerance protein CutA [Bdellovibrionaceae bacterium]|nr:divalent-cation tolerance protein CutA [Pseudobdellovibrionaceae bacterium]
MKSKIVLAYCTFPSEAITHQICERLVSENTIACANIIGPVKSIYKWKGETVKELEWVAIMKTSKFKQATLKERIRAIHPYTVPALVFLPVADGLPEFLNWVYAQSL